MRYDEYDLSGREWALFFGAGYGGVFFLLMVFYDSLLLSLTGGFLCVFLLPFYKGYLMERRRTLLLQQFKDFLYAVSSSLSTGRQMDKAISDARDSLSLIYSKESPMMMELDGMVAGIREERGTEEVLLLDLALRSGLEDIRDFADVYCLCRELGGDMEEVITRAGKAVSDKISIQREIKVLTAQKQFEGRIISVMPVLVIAGLNTFAPDYLSVLYTTVAGRLLMTLALFGMGFSFFLIQKMMDIRV